MTELSVVRTWHDDWIMNVLLSDGRLYAFITELWWEHEPDDLPRRIRLESGSDTNWPAVTEKAKEEALWLAKRGAEPFCTISDACFSEFEIPKTVPQACLAMTDSEFSRLMRS